ncbi:MAG: hypothetical protein H0U51_09505 [Propionibacteriales bacterium]|nr:hypothetical protein [Propionibacteriales bacterium]
MSRAQHFFRDSLLPHLAGGVFGGLLAGVAAAGVAGLAELLLPADVVLAIAAVLVASFTVSETLGMRLWRPSARRQVSRDFQRTRYHRTTAFIWGADLGFGWSTKQPTSALLTATVVAASVGPELALTTGALFGVTRALTLVLAVGTSSRSSVEARFDWLRRHRHVPRVGTALTSSALTAALTLTIVY